MVKLKLKLKYGRPSTIYTSNGKSYKLKPGSNTLELEYEDYLALAKSLGIKPVENKKPDSSKEESNSAEPKKAEDPVKEKATAEEPTKEDPTAEADKYRVEDKKEVDYTTWSYTKLKAEYKTITGKVCKLKRDEVIVFLQEHNSDA